MREDISVNRTVIYCSVFLENWKKNMGKYLLWQMKFLSVLQASGLQRSPLRFGLLSRCCVLIIILKSHFGNDVFYYLIIVYIEKLVDMLVK